MLNDDNHAYLPAEARMPSGDEIALNRISGAYRKTDIANPGGDSEPRHLKSSYVRQGPRIRYRADQGTPTALSLVPLSKSWR
jgi:hypothetical protein